MRKVSARKNIENSLHRYGFVAVAGVDEVGSGCLDVPGLLQELRAIDYDGWLMVEQDSTWLSPLDSARQSRTYLHSLGL